MAVVDASVPVAALVDVGPDGQWAESVVARGGLVAAHLLPVETINVLRRLEGAGRLTSARAKGVEDVLSLPTTLLSLEPFGERIWALRATLTALRRLVRGDR